MTQRLGRWKGVRQGFWVDAEISYRVRFAQDVTHLLARQNVIHQSQTALAGLVDVHTMRPDLLLPGFRGAVSHLGPHRHPGEILLVFAVTASREGLRGFSRVRL